MKKLMLMATVAACLVLGATAQAAKGLQLSRLTFHPVSGTVEVVDAHTLAVRNFVYDGLGPDAFFIVGTKSASPNAADATPVPYPDTGKRHTFADKDVPVLGAFDGSKDVVLKLPADIPAKDVKWLSLFCRDYDIDFGNVVFAQQAAGGGYQY